MLARAALIAPADPAGWPTAQVACDLIWLHVTPPDRVEHIRVRSSRRGFDIVWFMLADDPGTARVRAQMICHDAITGTPLLMGWQVG